MNYNSDLVLEKAHAPSEERAKNGLEKSEDGYLNERQFDELTERLIYLATAHGMLPADALAALAKALGTLSAFTALREGQSVEEVVKASQDAVETFAKAAEIYMKRNSVEGPEP